VFQRCLTLIVEAQEKRDRLASTAPGQHHPDAAVAVVMHDPSAIDLLNLQLYTWPARS